MMPLSWFKEFMLYMNAEGSAGAGKNISTTNIATGDNGGLAGQTQVGGAGAGTNGGPSNTSVPTSDEMADAKTDSNDVLSDDVGTSNAPSSPD